MTPLAAAIGRVRRQVPGAGEATIIHDDADFDTLATVLPFESVWVAPCGSLD